MLRFTAIILLASAATASDLRMNDIQFIATHNSYHVSVTDLPKDHPNYRDKTSPEWDYTHPPLDIQLDRGIRGFELDVFYQEAGYFLVQHVPMLDNGTSCDRFVDCLTAIRDWSLAHPTHVPIIAHIEVKDSRRSGPGPILEVNRPELDIMEAEIRSVFEPEHLIEPDDIRGDYATVNEAITTDGWPLLDDMRGKVAIVLHNRGRHREEFLKGDPTITGRAMFNFAVPGEPDAAFLIRDNPTGKDVPDLVRQGYIIRTRAGSPANPDRVRAAFASGGHLVSTDNPPGVPHEETGEIVAFEGGATVRCNPVSRSEPCPEEAIAP